MLKQTNKQNKPRKMPTGLVKEPRHTEHLSEGNASCSSVFANSNNAKSIGSPIWKECDDVMVHTRFADGVRVNHKSRQPSLGTGGMDYDGERIRHPIRSEPSERVFSGLLRAWTHTSSAARSFKAACNSASTTAATVEVTRRAHQHRNNCIRTNRKSPPLATGNLLENTAPRVRSTPSVFSRVGTLLHFYEYLC